MGIRVGEHGERSSLPGWDRNAQPAGASRCDAHHGGESHSCDRGSGNSHPIEHFGQYASRGPTVTRADRWVGASRPRVGSGEGSRFCHTGNVANVTAEDASEPDAKEISSLFAGVEAPFIEFDRRLSQTALAWQANGNDADFAEMSAVVNRAEPGRMYVIVGRIASAGEQLGLAGLAYRDARAWLEKGGTGHTVRIPARALAEVVSYFALSAAHGIANVTARLLALELRSREVLASREKHSGGFKPFDPKDAGWLPINARTVASLEAAVVHHQPAVTRLVALLRSLIDDADWSRLVEQRHTNFHRWRPQSIEGGVAASSPWLEYEDYQVLAVRDGGTLIPDSHERLIMEVGLGLERLEETMRAWLELFPDARQGVLTYVLAKSMGDVDLDIRDR